MVGVIGHQSLDNSVEFLTIVHPRITANACHQGRCLFATMRKSIFIKGWTVERLWKILVSPRQEFDEMREDTPILLPLLTILVFVGVCAAIIVFMTPDETFKERGEAQIEMLENLGQSDAAEQQRNLLDDPSAISMMRTTGAIGALIGGPIGMVIVLLLVGTFYSIVGKIVKSDASWSDWFGFSCWVSIPVAIGSVVSLIFMAIGSTALAEGGLAVLGWFGMNAPWAMAITIPALWTLYITINGLDSWLQKGVVTSVIVALIPLVVSMLVASLIAGMQQAMQSMMGGG